MIKDKANAYALLAKYVPFKNSSQSLKRNLQRHALVFLCRVDPPRERKTTPLREQQEYMPSQCIKRVTC